MTSPAETAHLWHDPGDLERRQPVAPCQSASRRSLPWRRVLGSIPGWRSLRAIGRVPMRKALGTARLRATQVADRFHVLRVNLRKRWTRSSPRITTPSPRSMPRGTSSRSRCSMDAGGPRPTASHPRTRRNSRPPSARRSDRRATSRPLTLHRQGWPSVASCCPGGRSSCRNHRAVSALRRRGLRGSIAATMDSASSTRIRPISWSALERRLPHRHPTVSGAPTAGLHRAIAVSPRMLAASARPRASHPAARAGASSCRWWRSRSPSFDAPPGDVAVLRREEQRTVAEAQQLTQLWPSRPRSLRRSTSRRTLPLWYASGSRTNSIRGSRVQPPVPWSDAALCDRAPRRL